jgi:signal peptidase I
MLDVVGGLIAQTDPGGVLGFVDRLARTQLSTVVMFVAGCTIVRLALWAYMRGKLPHQRSGFFTVAKFLNETVDALVYAGVLVFLVIRPFALQTFFIPSESMLDTLRINDYIVANKFVYRTTDPEVGDIVVFRPPKRAFRGPETDFIKRCLGVPGDVVEIRNGVLFHNGKRKEEPYVYRGQPSIFDFKLIEWKGQIIPLVYSGETGNDSLNTRDEFRITDPDEMRKAIDSPAQPIPPGYYLMIGDNRNGSDDSRYWGLVPRRQIVGRSEVIWMPISRWRVTR